MTKNTGEIVKASSLARRNTPAKSSRMRGNTRQNRLSGQRGLPYRTPAVVDVGGGWTYEI